MANVERVCAHAHAKLQQAAGFTDGRAAGAPARYPPAQGQGRGMSTPPATAGAATTSSKAPPGTTSCVPPAQAYAAAKAFGGLPGPDGRPSRRPPPRDHPRLPPYPGASPVSKKPSRRRCPRSCRLGGPGDRLRARPRPTRSSVIVDALRAGALPERVTHNDTEAQQRAARRRHPGRRPASSTSTRSCPARRSTISATSCAPRPRPPPKDETDLAKVTHATADVRGARPQATSRPRDGFLTHREEGAGSPVLPEAHHLRDRPPLPDRLA
jgi:hypothetical protein